jgi:hypothetical protein
MSPEWLQVLRYILGALLGVLGIGSVVTNIASVVRMIRGRGHSSLIPFIGGLSLALATVILPIRVPRWLVLVLLVLDPGVSFYLMHGVSRIVKLLFRSTSE